MESNSVKLKDIATIQTGPFGSQLHKKDYVEKGIPIITVEHLGENQILHKPDTPNVDDTDYKRLQKYILKKDDIVFSRVGSVDRRALVSEKEDGWLFSGRCLRVRIEDKTIANPKYISYIFGTKSFKSYIRSIAVGATMPSINTKILSNIEVLLPSKEVQNYIVNILHNIDKKIWLNEKIIANLEELSQTLFKRWFIDFEFPDENGNPYKLSDGEMISSKVGQIPSNFSLGELESLIDIYNTKRKPLSRMERDKQEKIYPYYGATKIIDYVDDYKFNGKYVLVGEDGTVKTDNGAPFTQYVYGKFWVSNHAHILKGKNISDEILLLILNNIDIDPYITGAVQPKLNKKNLLSIETIIAPIELYTKFNKIIEPYFKKIIEIEEESLLLRELRDTLLPKLMSGELELPEALEV